MADRGWGGAGVVAKSNHMSNVAEPQTAEQGCTETGEEIGFPVFSSSFLPAPFFGPSENVPV